MQDQKAAAPSPLLSANLDGDAAEDFFSSMAQQNEEEESAKRKEEEERALAAVAAASNTSVVDWNAGPEALIKQNFLIGSRDAAVEICLKCNRVADALLIAYADPDLFHKVGWVWRGGYVWTWGSYKNGGVQNTWMLKTFPQFSEKMGVFGTSVSEDGSE